MRLFIGSLMIFFGTLLLAALLALGRPVGLGVPAWQDLSLQQSQPQQPAGPAAPPWRRLVAMVLPN